jgi:hypothetical protein
MFGRSETETHFRPGMISRTRASIGCFSVCLALALLVLVVAAKACSDGRTDLRVRIDLTQVADCMERRGWTARIVNGVSIDYSRPGSPINSADLKPDLAACTAKGSNVELPIEIEEQAQKS